MAFAAGEREAAMNTCFSVWPIRRCLPPLVANTVSTTPRGLYTTCSPLHTTDCEGMSSITRKWIIHRPYANTKGAGLIPKERGCGYGNRKVVNTGEGGTLALAAGERDAAMNTCFNV